MIHRVNVYRTPDGLTFERSDSLPVVFTALTARQVEFDGESVWLYGRRRPITVGPLSPSGLILAARRRYYRLRVWYDHVDARRNDDAERYAKQIVEAAGGTPS